MEDGSLAVSQHRTTLHQHRPFHIAPPDASLIVPAPCGDYKPIHTERSLEVTHLHTCVRRELGCATPTVSRGVHASEQHLVCSLLLSPVHHRVLYTSTHSTARQWAMHRCPAANHNFPTLSTPPAASSCCNEYDARRSTNDGAGAYVTRTIHARYAWLPAVRGRVG